MRISMPWSMRIATGLSGPVATSNQVLAARSQHQMSLIETGDACLVETDWLKKHLDDQDPVIFKLRIVAPSNDSRSKDE